MKNKDIKPGQTGTFACGNCNRDFEILLEPNAVGFDTKTMKESGFKPAKVTHCPFCGDPASLEQRD